MSYLIRKSSEVDSQIDNEISSSIIGNDSKLLRSTLSNLSEDGRSEILNRVDFYGNTFLGLACNTKKDDEILKVLIENGANVNQSDFYGRTPLQYACLAEDVEVIDALVKTGAHVNFMEDRYAALHTAASVGNAAIVRRLIELGANPNILTKKGVSPLHCAVEFGHLDCIKALLDCGAQVNFPHDAKRKSKSFSFVDPVLIIATGLGNIEAVTMLLQFGAKPNSLSYYGVTALNVSCNRHFNDITKVLLQYGSDINISDRNGSIPLHYAARHGDLELVKMILSKDGPKNVLDKHGESPLNYAIRSQNIEVIKLLLDHGCCPNLYNPIVKDSQPPILRATCSFSDEKQFEQVLLALIRNGCDINECLPKTFETAIFKALDLKKNEIAKILLKHNARTDVECPHGLTILNMACQRNMADVVEDMCRLGFDLARENWLVRGGNWTCMTNRELGRSFFETPDPSVPTIFWNKMKLYLMLKEYMRSVQSLQSLCRHSIRRDVRRNFYESVRQLGLPSRLENFLMLADVQL